MSFLYYVRLLWEGKWIILGLILIAGGGTYLHNQNQPRKYTASAVVLLERSAHTDYTEMSVATRTENRVADELYFLRHAGGLSRHVKRRILSKRDSMSPTPGPSLFWTRDGSPRPDADLSALIFRTATFRRDAQTVPAIRISVTTTHPNEAAIVANAYAEAYRAYRRRASKAQMRTRGQFLQRQKKELQSTLRAIADSIDIRKQVAEQRGLVHASVDDGARMSSYQHHTQQIADLRFRKNQVELDLKLERALLDSAQGRLQRIRPNLADRAASTTSAELQAIHQRIAELEHDIRTIKVRHEALSAERRDQVETMNARLQELNAQANRLAKAYVEGALSTDAINPFGDGEGLSAVVALRQKITERRVAITRLEAKLNVLEDRLASRPAFLQQSPDRTLARFERRKHITRELFVSLSKRLQQAQVFEASTSEQTHIIRRAAPPSRPVGPNIWNNVVVAALLGGIGGGGLVLLYDRFDDVIETAEALDQGRNEVFGMILEWEVENDSAVNEKGRSWSGIAAPFSRAAKDYRRLATNVQLGLPNDISVLTVTSPGSGEGKTTTAINLAVALSESGKDVLLLDADLRRGTLHRTFDVDRAPGLTDQLADVDEAPHVFQIPFRPRNQEAGSASNGKEGHDHIRRIQQNQMGQIGLLPAGREVRQPALLLQRSNMHSLLDTLSDSWDLVLIDTPPSLLYDDASRIAALSDLVLLIAAIGSTLQSDFREARSHLTDTVPPNVVTVLNRYEQTTSREYGYHGDSEYDPHPSAQGQHTRMSRFSRRVTQGIRRAMKG